MVQNLKRAFETTRSRVLLVLCAGLLSATIGYSLAQTIFFDESQTVSSLDELIQRYQAYRDDVYMMVVPDWYLWPDQVERHRKQVRPRRFSK